MVHRDPETGQFVAHGDDEPVEITYSDHEFVNFVVETRIGEEQLDDNKTAEYQVETDVLDLENDELGMLTWLSASLSVTPEGFPEVGGEETRGSAHVQAELGANLAGSEFIAQTEGEQDIQTVQSDANVGAPRLQASDDPGLWAHLNASATSGFKDADADGSYAGQGSPDNDRIRRVFGEETSGGPYIDSTDDINIGLYMDLDKFDTALVTVVYGQMSFLVFEYENRRAEFAPYDPGPSM